MVSKEYNNSFSGPVNSFVCPNGTCFISSKTMILNVEAWARAQLLQARVNASQTRAVSNNYSIFNLHKINRFYVVYYGRNLR